MTRILLKIEALKLSSLQCQEMTCQDVSWAIWDLFHIYIYIYIYHSLTLIPNWVLTQESAGSIISQSETPLVLSKQTITVCYQCRPNDVCLIKLPACP